MAKYTYPPGDFLDMLQEECAEVIQAVCKLRRFGPTGAAAPGYIGPTPVQQLHQELGDLIVVIEHLIDPGGPVDWFKVAEAAIWKNARLRELFGVERSKVRTGGGGAGPGCDHGGTDTVKTMTAATVRERLAKIRQLAVDPEAAHSAEDDLYTDLLRAIANGKCEDPAKCAKLALTSRKLRFDRWCA
jgi:hypothetical protein